jgi:hypothetical protein
MVDPVQWQALPIAWRQNSVKPQLILLKQTQSQRLLSSQVAEAVAEKQRQEKGLEEDKVSKTFSSLRKGLQHIIRYQPNYSSFAFIARSLAPLASGRFFSLLTLTYPLNGQKGT